MTGLNHIASYIAQSNALAIPVAARELATLALVDFVGSALAGASEPVSQLVARHCGASVSIGSASIIGHGIRARPVEAAFANGVIGHALDFDDSNMVLGGHPSVTLFPALLALGQSRGCSGREVLDAYVVGFEVLMAFAHAVNFEHYEKGWHPTATLGAFGAVAAAAKLLGLNEQQAGCAIGLAASMASGIKANFGTMAKPLQVGEASRRGVMCALLAADGCTASPTALEAKQGFFNIYNGSGQFRLEALCKLGDGFELFRSGIQFKKYPCCGSTHAPIDAALKLKKQYGFSVDQIEEVRIAMNPRRRPHVDRLQVTDQLSAKFSVQYTVAAALADGAVQIAHFTDDAIQRVDLQALLRRVVLVDHDGASALSQGCEVTVKTARNKSVSVHLEDAQGRGSEAYQGYMKQKFDDCVQKQLDPAQAKATLEALLSFDSCTPIDALMSRLSGKAFVPPSENLQ